MTKAKKICLVLGILVIIIGIIVYAALGFKFDLQYGAGKRIAVEMKNDFDVKDIKSIAYEIYGVYDVEVITNFKDAFMLKVQDTNDEQLDKLANKINEKYGYSYTKDDIKVTETALVNFFDILKKVLIPMLISTIVITAYMMIRYRKENIFKVLLNSIIPELLSVLFVLAIYAIFRIPVNNLLLPILLTSFAISVIYSTLQYEKN